MKKNNVWFFISNDGFGNDRMWFGEEEREDG